jgi:uncharacterized phage protein (TIGR01671 family)
MRDIKFRAWDKEKKQMVDWEWLEIYLDGARIIDEEGKIFDASDMPLMQFTGLTDKNGKEIYEGDLIKDQNGDIREIVFEDGGFWCKYPDGQQFMPTEETREIIGNIWENPELLI